MRDQIKRIELLQKAYTRLNRGRWPQHCYMHKAVHDDLREQCSWLRLQPGDPADEMITMILGMHVHVFDGDQHKTTLELTYDALPLWRFGA